MDTFTIDRDAHYYHFNEEMTAQVFKMIGQKHYPHRIPPQKWPDMKWIGKAMVRGWLVPCRYYPRPCRGGGYCRSFVFPGVPEAEYRHIQAVMRRRNYA